MVNKAMKTLVFTLFVSKHSFVEIMFNFIGATPEMFHKQEES